MAGPARVQRGVLRRRGGATRVRCSASRTAGGTSSWKASRSSAAGIARYARARPHASSCWSSTRNADRCRAASPTSAGCSPTSATLSRRRGSSTTAPSRSRRAVRCRAVEASIARIHNTSSSSSSGKVGLEVLGADGAARRRRPDAPLAGEVRRHWLRNIPTTVAAGTLEMQKNIVAQRGLGLPRPLSRPVDLFPTPEQAAPASTPPATSWRGRCTTETVRAARGERRLGVRRRRTGGHGRPRLGPSSAPLELAVGGRAARPRRAALAARRRRRAPQRAARAARPGSPPMPSSRSPRSCPARGEWDGTAPARAGATLTATYVLVPYAGAAPSWSRQPSRASCNVLSPSA